MFNELAFVESKEIDDNWARVVRPALGMQVRDYEIAIGKIRFTSPRTSGKFCRSC